MADFFLCLPSCACVRRKVCACVLVWADVAVCVCVCVFVPVCVVRSWWMDVLVKSLSQTWLSEWAGTDCSRWQRQAGDWKSYSRSALLHVGGGEQRRGKRILKFRGRERRGVSSVSPEANQCFQWPFREVYRQLHPQLYTGGQQRLCYWDNISGEILRC